MNGFKDHGLDESDFGESSAIKAVKAFDAFPKTKASYTEQTSSGGAWTLVLICASVFLAFSELQRWWAGETTHSFSVEQGVGHDLQINLDVVIAMKCSDINLNVQDASGDRIMASLALSRDPTTWAQWGGKAKGHALGASKEERLDLSGYPGFGEYREEDVHDYVGNAKRSKTFKKTPKVPRGKEADSCRVFGSMHGNKVQGDFHITARGHGYFDFGQHLPHTAFNFTHHINELSFGPYYPSLVNPLDNTVAQTDQPFHKFQYYLSIVPTIYTTDAKTLRKIDKHAESPSSGEDGLQQYPASWNRHAIFTNQYAVTEQSHDVPEHSLIGIFIKYDIEPIQLTIAEEWDSFPAMFVRLVNVVSGLVVAGGWCFELSEWARDVYGRRSRRTDSFGVLHGQTNDKRVI